MAPSAVSRAKPAFLASQGTLLVILDLLKQMRADLKSANNVFALIQIVLASTRRLWYLKHSRPIPPVVVNTKGINAPCSTWDYVWVLTLLLIFMHFVNLLCL